MSLSLSALSAETAIMLEAAGQTVLQPEEIVRWADGVVVAMDQAPGWIIDLCVLNSPHLIDFLAILRQQANPPVSLHQRVQLVVLAYFSGRVPFTDTLSRLFRLLHLEGGGALLAEDDELLSDLLMEWDCQDDLERIEPPLQEKFEARFCRIVATARDLAALLQWEPSKRGG